MQMLAALGVAYVVLGALLAWRPLTAARAVNHLRFAPFSANNESQYRATGIALSVLGSLLAGMALATI